MTFRGHQFINIMHSVFSVEFVTAITKVAHCPS